MSWVASIVQTVLAVFAAIFGWRQEGQAAQAAEVNAEAAETQAAIAQAEAAAPATVAAVEDRLSKGTF